mmetsp:Transcript_145882/g.370511  ORF Transcript_145882/g.370511 Transcript_145882/m.370511 type:complete len:426 (-) Transcript_145882:113-1390(-)
MSKVEPIGGTTQRVTPEKDVIKMDVIKIPVTPPVWDADLMAAVDKTIGPDFTDDPLVKRYNLFCDGKLEGKQYKLTMSSKDSTIYPGVVTVKDAVKQLEDAHQRLPDHEHYAPFGGVQPFKGMACNATTPEISKPQAYKRQLEVFVPEGVDPSEASPFMIFLDGLFVLENLGHIAPFFRRLRQFCGCCCSGAGGTAADAISYTKTMDNLFKEKQLEPMVCIFLDPGPQDETCIWGSQRNFELDAVSSKFTDFVEQEVLPFVSEKCGVKLTTNPDQRAVMGTSSGGNAAITMGLTGRFNRILTQSPSCVNLGYPYNPQAPLQGWDYHSGKELIKNQGKVEGLRVVVVTNEFDLWYQSDVKYHFNWVAASLRTAKALKEKGYACLHIFTKEGIHVDPRGMAQCFPDAVKWIWSDKPAKPFEAWSGER